MNTGVQRSGATPPAARTATNRGGRTGAGKSLRPGEERADDRHGARRSPTVATATVADLRDIEYKVERAMSFHGARYLHILVTCPLGWGCDSADTIRVARLATQSGLFPVFEAEQGEITAVTKIRQRVPVEEYLRLQKRYAHLFGRSARPDIVARLQAQADRNIARFDLLENQPVGVS